MPINASNALTLAHQLRVYTAEAASFSDMMDVVYVAQMIWKFLGYVDQIKEVRFHWGLLETTLGNHPHPNPICSSLSCLSPRFPAPSHPQWLPAPIAGGGDGGHGQ